MLTMVISPQEITIVQMATRLFPFTPYSACLHLWGVYGSFSVL